MTLFPRDLQQLLGVEADGLIGPKTRAAIERWFRDGVDLMDETSEPPPAEQRMSAQGLDDLILSEGLRLTAYRDSVGVWTIGVGHAATSGRPPIPRAGMRITREEAMRILADDLREAYEPAVRAVLGPVPQHVFDGAVSFHFNTGGIKRASWTGHWKAGRMREAEAAFMSWKRPPEIVGRRRREADLIFRGKYAT